MEFDMLDYWCCDITPQDTVIDPLRHEDVPSGYSARERNPVTLWHRDVDIITDERLSALAGDAYIAEASATMQRNSTPDQYEAYSDEDLLQTLRPRSCQSQSELRAYQEWLREEHNELLKTKDNKTDVSANNNE